MNDAGLQMQFINRVAHYVNEWAAKDFPGREIRLVVFAYYATETPPVKQDANGKWVPFSDKVIPAADNIDFYFAPIYTDYSKTLTDVENQDVYSIISSITSIILIRLESKLHSMRSMALISFTVKARIRLTSLVSKKCVILLNRKFFGILPKITMTLSMSL